MLPSLIFLFKQKTAYEMRISDWSSDVCSSDLGQHHHRHVRIAAQDRGNMVGPQGAGHRQVDHRDIGQRRGVELRVQFGHGHGLDELDIIVELLEFGLDALDDEARSEEHTYERQSLIRISYGVFCLEKKIQNK